MEEKLERSFAKLRSVKSILMNMASRSRTLQDITELADEW